CRGRRARGLHRGLSPRPSRSWVVSGRSTSDCRKLPIFLSKRIAVIPPPSADSQPHGDEESAPSVRVKIEIAYDGSGFSGWARQEGRRTVAGTLAETLGQVLRLPEPPLLVVAGRTDAGVHARGQVAHADLPGQAWTDAARQRGQKTLQAVDVSAAAARRLLRRLATALPPDIRVRAIAPAPQGLDARVSALWRRHVHPARGA